MSRFLQSPAIASQPKEQVKFWRDPALRNLEMLRATYIRHSFSRHAHEGFGIAIVESGAMEFEYRGQLHIAPAGSVVITHPGEMHTGRAVLETGWTYCTLLPAIEWLQQAAEGLTKPLSSIPYFSSPVIQDKRLNRKLVSLHRKLETSPSPLEKESLFFWEMSQLVLYHASQCPALKPIGKEHKAVEQIRDYLNAHYTTNVSLSELSTLVNLKPLRLLRSFRKQIGLPPHAYLNYVRIRQAKKLLLTGRSIVETAVDTGFSDQSHLHRHFKRMTGVTPGQYVKG